MATTWKAPTWRMPNEKNQNKFESYSVDFDSAISNYINCGGQSLLNGLTAFSVSCWIKRNGTQQSYAAVLSYQTSTSQYLKLNFNTYTDKIEMAIRPGTVNPARVVSSAGSIPDGEWVHIAVVGDANNLSNLNMYINGALDNDVTSGNITTLAQSSDIYIGTDAGAATTREFNGEISQTCIFDYALSSTQVSSLYNSGSPINPMTLKPAPVAYYPLGGNASTAGNIGSDTLSIPNIAVPDASVFDFNGSSNQFINNGYFNELDSSDLSFSIWLKKTNTDYAQVVDSQTAGNSGILIAINSSDQVFVRVNTLTASTTTSGFANIGFQRDKWQNIILTYNNTTRNLIVYLNNQPVSNTTGSLTTKGASLELKIGGVSGSYFTGQISNAQIWSTELSSSEVETLYNSGVPLLTGTQPQASSLKAWYKLDQSANWEADTTANWQIPDAVSSYPQSFDFDGSINEGITVPYNANLEPSSQFTMSCWFKSETSQNSYAYPVYKESSNTAHVAYGFYLQNTTTIATTAIDTGSGVTILQSDNLGNLRDNKWHHLVQTYDGTQMKVYLDGVQSGSAKSATGTVSYSSTYQDLYIGETRHTSPSGYYSFKGKISNVQVFDSALPETGTDSVETLYNNGVPLTTAIASDNLKAWYKLDNTEKFDGTDWSIENQKYPASYESALKFPGPSTGNKISFSPLTINVTQANTYSAWVYPIGNTSFWTIIAGAYSGTTPNIGPISLNSAGGSSWAIRSTQNAMNQAAKTVTSNSISNSELGKWHHIMVVVDNLDVSFYLNGQPHGTATFTNPWTSSTIDLFSIGQFSNWVPNGYMSNVAIWNSDQSTNIANIYNNGTPQNSYTVEPIALWRLDNTTTGLNDIIGGKNGTLTGDITKVNTFVSTEAGASSGMTEQNLVNNNVSALNGESSGMNTSNLVTSTLTRQVPYNSYSLYFDGVDDYIDCGDNDIFSFGNGTTDSPFTLSAWFKADVLSSDNRFVISKFTTSTQREYLLELQSGSVSMALCDTSNSSNRITVNHTTGVTFETDRWYHIAFTYDGSATTDGADIYVDGVIASTATKTKSLGYVAMGNKTAPLKIGERSGKEFKGLISNVSIFNEELTSTDIVKIYNSGVPSDLSSFNPSPLAWWSLGSDSYFNGANYICPNLTGTINGTSNSMDANSLVGDAPNSSANGTSINMTIDANLTGNAPNSNNNSFSVNMSYDDRVSGSGDVPG